MSLTITTIRVEKIYRLNGHPDRSTFCTGPGFVNHIYLSTAETMLPIYDDQYEGSPLQMSSQAEIDFCHHLRRTTYPDLRYRLSRDRQKKLTFLDGSKVYLDGWDEKSGTAIEVLGCFYHGHSISGKCAQENNQNP